MIEMLHRDDTDQIDDIMDIREIETKHGIIIYYLVRWSGRPMTIIDCTWMDEAKLEHQWENLFQHIFEVNLP